MDAYRVCSHPCECNPRYRVFRATSVTGSGLLSLTGTLTGFSVGQRAVNVQWNLTAAQDDTEPVTLAVGNNLIMIPPGVSMVLIEPPPGNTVVITMKGAPTDAGVPLHRTLAHWQSLDSSAVSFYLSVPSVLSGSVQLAFF